ncbi:pentapeptide repeat-containing protein [Nocardia sp. NPDC005366]|uniref:pentapeptide repeat-containing protein n=1 Tax=Nocardia sp. NPDC005366 TaxID=3156878 RepID=UPI0033B02E1B
MSEGEKTNGELVPRRGRWFWPGIAVTVAGAMTAGFSAAVVSGVPTSFGQPLATIIGGTGVLAAGTLAYLTGQRSREQAEAHHKIDSRHERESALRDRYTSIATQIANESAAIRQAGVYALTALADDWHTFGEDDERQVCINLLQWYLRVPFPESDDLEKPDLAEREIRQTIVRILSERRLRSSADPKSWMLASISLHSVSLSDCDLANLVLTDIKLGAAKLNGAKLGNAKLNDTDLFGAELNRADLFAAKLNGANLFGAELNGANLDYAKLNGANLFRARLNGASLSNADLSGANLIGANLTGAKLSNADLSDAKLSGTDLHNADLSDAELRRAVHDSATVWPVGFTAPDPPT